MIKKLLNYIKVKDSVTIPSALQLHFDGDIKIKTLGGGLISILIQLYVLYIAISKGVRMVNYE